MCGVAGWYNRDGRPVDARALENMSASLRHRGPDDHGLWHAGQVAFAHRRLAIRDLSPGGHQPQSDIEQRVFVTYNGELYNDGALRHELERDYGARFRTTCDTELLPYAYLAWGEEMFARLEGMFAIALWDVRRQRLILARDGIGIKPLLYAEAGDAVIFASEMKGILASRRIAPDLDPQCLQTYLAAGHAGPARTIVTGVKQVPPGSLVVFSREGCRTRQFWSPNRSADITDQREALDALSATFAAVVGSQLIGDVPVSILQSGGIDSTLISLAAGRTNAHIPLFTASFNEPTFDEVGLARQVAKAAGLPHEVISVDTGDLATTFRSMVHHLDAQCADTGALGYYCLSRSVRKHCTVALSGDGGDEFFAGYETYAATRMAEILRRVVPSSLARRVGDTAYRMNPADESRLSMTSVISRFAMGLSEGGSRPHLEWRRLLPAALEREVYGPAMADFAGMSPYRDYAAFYDAATGSVIDRAMAADQQFHLQSVLAKVDAMSMAHGLEVRVPFLDRRIMDLAGRFSTQLLNRWGGRPKALLRTFARSMGAPATVTDARKKGFNVPIARMLRRELAPIGNDIFMRNADVLAPYFNSDAIRKLWLAHQEGRSNHAFALWPMLVLGVWRAGLAGAGGMIEARG